jgi:hypothetical protein
LTILLQRLHQPVASQPSHEGIGGSDTFHSDGIPLLRERHLISGLEAHGRPKRLWDDDLSLAANAVIHTNKYDPPLGGSSIPADPGVALIANSE